MPDAAGTGLFDVAALAASLPASAKTLLCDTYPTDREAASARVFRVNPEDGTPATFMARNAEG
ncbi:hypothetical protein FVE89_04785 [Methylobacterium sp. 2A]|jgi:hypothetical protein|uniref:hypothetical protein n=1 Tax=Methylobacterium sp. 2A TaxID=2603816 RepID=UPI0013530A3F|nr:hypothetical protein [Methylobacterium sp. 2A]MWV21324.1 hypothetical protein [Methylobacterium sp. 2A]